MMMADRASYETASHSANPSQQAWERNRARIELLYLEENRTLAEVMAIMKRDHNFKATVKMYKQRLKTWSLDSKNLKRDEVKQIACNFMTRNVTGKLSQFRKKGRNVNFQDVLRYVRRRGCLSLEDFARAASPATERADVECYTPVPVSGPIEADLNNTSKQLVFMTLPPWISQPEAYQIPQFLFWHAQLYLQGSFDAKVLSDCEKRWLQSHKSQHRCCGSHNDNFLDYYNTSKSLMIRGDYVRGRQLLARACRMVERQLATEDPDLIRALAVAHMCSMTDTQYQLWEVVLRHFCRRAFELLGLSHPLTQFSKMLPVIDSSVTKQMLNPLLACTIEILESHIGIWHRTVISARSQLLMTSDNPAEEQNYIGKLSDYELRHGRGDKIWLQMMYSLAWKLGRQGRCLEAETVVQDLLAADNSNTSSYSLRSLVVLSFVRQQTGDVLAAAKITQSCVEMCVQVWGWDDPDTVYQIIRLADFAKALGRVQHAAELETTLQQILGPPDIEELLEP